MADPWTVELGEEEQAARTWASHSRFTGRRVVLNSDGPGSSLWLPAALALITTLRAQLAAAKEELADERAQVCRDVCDLCDRDELAFRYDRRAGWWHFEGTINATLCFASPIRERVYQAQVGTDAQEDT